MVFATLPVPSLDTHPTYWSTPNTSIPKPQLATTETNRIAGRLSAIRASCYTIVGYV